MASAVIVGPEATGAFFGLARGQDLHVSAADVDDQYLHGNRLAVAAPVAGGAASRATMPCVRALRQPLADALGSGEF